ncbi:oligosaccharide flippase family protein [Photobacterium leiognathi]|uniref:oligosaccharide flippase family protein n=1 Tax=Photobacterium leiognathi TaxID=553611 RepID=UPI0029820C9F|nr:oligosaccharide flippase family protein [Photobacterium leiognathi]
MNNKLYQAIKMSISGKLMTYIVQFVFLAIYARIFTPQEFGIIASVQVFVLFFQLLSEVGIGPAIINEEEFKSEQRDGIFTVTLIIGVFLFVLFYIFSFVLNVFFHGVDYQDIAVYVCIGIFFNSLNILPTTSLNKDTKFIELSIINILTEVVAFIVVYSLYKFNYGVLALAARTSVQGGVRFILTWYKSKDTELGRAYFGSQIYHIKKILSFSLYQFGFNFINYFSRNLDNILIAKFFGMVPLGVYDKAYQLMRYPLMLTTSALSPAIQPVLKKYRHNIDLIVKEHNTLTRRLTIISILISFFINLNSESIVLFLFGHQWLGVILIIEVFCFMIPIQAVLSSSGPFFQVINKPKLLFISGCFSAFFNVGAILFGVYLGGIYYISVSLVFSFFVNFFLSYYILFKFGFKRNAMGFYISILKSIQAITLPLILYYLIHVFYLENIQLSPFYDICLNIFIALLCLVPSYRKLKYEFFHV